MHSQFRHTISEKLDKLQIVLTVPGAYRAHSAGCHLDLYKMVYRLYAMGITPETILDIGAYQGMFSKCAHYVFPDAMIYAFEPLKDYYRDLLALKKTVKNLNCYNFAVAEKPGEANIHRSSFGASSSLLEMDDLHKEAFPKTRREQLEKIQVETLDSIFAGMTLERPVLMKIDVQGSESMVLVGGIETLKQTDFIVCEMSFRTLYKSQALFNEVYLWILNAGFRYCGDLAQLLHPETSEVLQVDGLFVRNR